MKHHFLKKSFQTTHSFFSHQLTRRVLYNTPSQNNVFTFDNYIRSMETFEIPNGINEIGENAFFGCSSFKSIIIPDSVTVINEGAFAHCTSLTSISIPKSVSKIHGAAFYGCTSLRSIHISEGLFEIGKNAFYGCPSLTSIMMPDSVSKIGINAFKNCSNLKQITSNKQDLFDEHQFDDIDNIEFLNHLSSKYQSTMS